MWIECEDQTCGAIWEAEGYSPGDLIRCPFCGHLGVASPSPIQEFRRPIDDDDEDEEMQTIDLDRLAERVKGEVEGVRVVNGAVYRGFWKDGYIVYVYDNGFIAGAATVPVDVQDVTRAVLDALDDQRPGGEG